MVHVHRRRYLVIHVTSPPGVGKGLLIKLIRDRTRELSEEDFRKVRPWFVYYRSGWAIIRTWHRGVRMLEDIIRDLDGTRLKEGELRINLVGCSGTLKKAFYGNVPPAVREMSHYREHRKR